LRNAGRKPKNLQADRGTEFFNREFKPTLVRHGINLYAVRTDKKACVVERFNRTLKEKMFRYFTYNNTKRYVDVLDDLVNSYNNTYHRTIRMCPSDVTEEHVPELWKLMFLKNTFEKIKFSFNIGDYVRIKVKKNIFSKGYTQGWQKQLYIISQRFPKNPPVYKIKPLRGRPLLESFYTEELQRIFPKETDLFSKVEKIIDITEVDGILYNLVRWSGLTEDFDTWVPAEKLVNNTFMDIHEPVEIEERREEINNAPIVNEVEQVRPEDLNNNNNINNNISDRPRRPNAGKRKTPRFIEEQEQESVRPRNRRVPNQVQANIENNNLENIQARVDRPIRTTAGRRIQRRYIEEQEEEQGSLVRRKR
jgi:hypothetical protein